MNGCTANFKNAVPPGYDTSGNEIQLTSVFILDQFHDIELLKCEDSGEEKRVTFVTLIIN